MTRSKIDRRAVMKASGTLAATGLVAMRGASAAPDTPAVPNTGNILSVRQAGAAADATTNDGPAIQRCLDHAARTGQAVVFPAGVYRVATPLHVGEPVLRDWRGLITRTDRVEYTTILDRLIDRAAYSRNRERYRPVSIHFEGQAVLLGDFADAPAQPILSYNIPGERGQATITGPGTFTAANGMRAGRYLAHDGNDGPATSGMIGLGIAVATLSRVADLQFGHLACGLAAVGSYWTRFEGMRADNCRDAFHLMVANAVNFSGQAWYCGRGLVYDGSASTLQLHTEQVGDDITLLSSEADLLLPCYLEDVDGGDGYGRHALTLGTRTGARRIIGLRSQGLRIGSLRPGKRTLRIAGAEAVTFAGARCYAERPATVDATSYGRLEDCDGIFQKLLPPQRFPAPAGLLGRDPRNGSAAAYPVIDVVSQLLPAVSHGVLAPGAAVAGRITLPLPVPLPFRYDNTTLRLVSGGDHGVGVTVTSLARDRVDYYLVNHTSRPLRYDDAIFFLSGMTFGSVEP